MKKNFTRFKKIFCEGQYPVWIVIFLNLFLLIGVTKLSAIPQLDEKDFSENFTPVILIIEGGTGSAEEVALHLSQRLVMNDFGVTVGITPYLSKRELTSSDFLVKKLRELHRLYPDKISFALQGLENVKNELKIPLPEQIHILSRAQSIFTQAFNEDRDNQFILATTLLPPYEQYSSEIAAAARQAGIKVVIGSQTDSSKGYKLLECDVVEIYADSETSMIADWKSLEIRSPEELVKSMTGILKESFSDNPVVMVIRRDSKSYPGIGCSLNYQHYS